MGDDFQCTNTVASPTQVKAVDVNPDIVSDHYYDLFLNNLFLLHFEYQKLTQ